MAPFSDPKAVITGIKEKVESLTVQGYTVGTALGNLLVYGIDELAENDSEIASLVEVKKSLTRRAIEQMGFIRDINSLVVLSGTRPEAKAAFSFAIHSFTQQHFDVEGKPSQPDIPTLITYLVVGCRRKVVIYTWRDGEAQEAKEAPLAHSARAMSFMTNECICFAYSPTEYAVFNMSSMTAVDVTMPITTSTTASGMGAFSGLTGYMTLGLGAKAKPSVAQIDEDNTLVFKDPFVKPYIFSVLPAGTVPAPESTSDQHQNPNFYPTTVLQIRSSLTLRPTQTISYPFIPPVTPPTGTTPQNASVRLLTASPVSKSPLYLVTTPTDRSAAAAEGSAIWQFSMKPWSEQIDELILSCQYSDALTLVDTIDPKILPDKDARKTRIRALHAVVALYPDTVGGRLSVVPDRWIPLFGGPAPPDEAPATPSSDSSKTTSQDKAPVDAVEQLAAFPSTGSIRGRLKTGLSALIAPTTPKDDDSASISSKTKRAVPDDFKRSIETLVRYLSDRRPKVDAALAAMGITPANQSHKTASLNETSVEDLFALPNAPLSALTPEQLLRFAQIVYTALFKSYLIIRPGLLGPLCRVPNWCEVSEVEEELRAHRKFGELIDLYKGKKMHDKALGLLKQLSEEEEDMLDKLQPSIFYLQRLGPEYLELIFAASRWIFDADRNMAFEIFTSEDVELPRGAVADYLEGIGASLCAKYLEYLIEERKEESVEVHDRLAELYLSMTLVARKRGDSDLHKDMHAKLLQFIDSTRYYSVDHLYGILSSERYAYPGLDLFEARAILLGRLGRHDQALELYAYRLHDYTKAEEYCKRYYEAESDSETSGIYLTLLRIYLQPTAKDGEDYLHPALDLISRHSPRLDAVETLKLLPPLVTAEDIRTFLVDALRAPIFDNRVLKGISKARNDQLSRRLMVLQTKRVKVTDSRICPQCHKRLGNSVIAVHSPRGEVTHYQCREAFSRRLNETRR
ncbi:vacuolar sorting protein 39 domain 1-domain-containing protein [Armillaria mellea]|nr:vacuolar sorting protein 39 domain 1-domain-containing protein [Armillaria mellea]